MYFRLFALVAVALPFAIPAMAADLVYEQPAPPADLQTNATYDWSGFYLGAQGGYSWNTATFLGSDRALDSGSAGGHAGYNFQHGNVVYGIENDFNYNFGSGSDETKVEWNASGRARVGYAWDRTLFFATGGVAAAGGKVDIPGIGKDDILIGWTAGGGVERAVTDNILVRGEYRYSDFGSKDFGSEVGDFGATQQKALFGASYKF